MTETGTPDRKAARAARKEARAKERQERETAKLRKEAAKFDPDNRPDQPPVRNIFAQEQFGPFTLSGTTLKAGMKSFDLHQTAIEFMQGGKQKRFTATRLVSGAAVGAMLGPVGLLGLKRKNLKANSITVADTNGQSYSYEFKQKEALKAQQFVMKVQTIQQGL
jgi:hypothetical protein